ncbi:type II toxin-antitoxin system RelE/ParE family toxin [Methylotuvimicrobium alcaliphilum]|uniref:Uncharacterized protein n=1 Tax=Methylotuvimicrobium alcaliphilum (strain DSM 19304 / NCIMB 14124 / VKM B-2133 / 20Z) TaxID=1091494 RepID=G4SZN8_META2|nr:hypothetical protein [Methylotuvimicrobium alcaliphilum]CCE24482.1 conserved protein of unknown function [Methylotuvimicrobium alcaliphilum 20Z]
MINDKRTDEFSDWLDNLKDRITKQRLKTISRAISLKSLELGHFDSC